MKRSIQVTEPMLPPLEEFTPFLERIWKTRRLTNGAYFHQELEIALAASLKVPYVSLFANGTIALIVALKALQVKGEVITTPFSFVATAHAIAWADLTPVFADIDINTFNLNPSSVVEQLSPKVGALMPVHCYGNPCDHKGLEEISSSRGVPLIFDAAHAFGVEINGRSILNWGDLSVLSFHATKVFNTFEGGAIICHDRVTKKRIDDLKNFGIEDEVTTSLVGLNGKMNEVQAAFGLLQLRHIDGAIRHRNKIDARYREKLASANGLMIPPKSNDLKPNCGYFPILIEGPDSRNRDLLFAKLRSEQIICRRYFYPLITNLPMYSGCRGASRDRLPIANCVANQILCLPIHTGLTLDQADMISDLVLRHLHLGRDC